MQAASPLVSVGSIASSGRTRSLRERVADSTSVETKYNGMLLQLLQPAPKAAEQPPRASPDTQLQRHVAELGGNLSLWPVPVTALQGLKGR